MTPTPHRSPGRTFIWLAVLIVLLAFTLRSVAILGLPLFVDEYVHIYRAHRVMEGHDFISLVDQKWLYTVVLAWFQPYGPESVWLGRMLTVLCSAPTVAVVIALGWLLGHRSGTTVYSTGLIAGLFYAVLPLAVFHERQALVDPMMAMFTALATLFMMQLARRPRIWLACLLALSLAGAYLTKASALPYLALPPVAALLLARRRDALWQGLVMGLLAAVAAWGLFLAVKIRAMQRGVVIWETHRATLGNTLLGTITSPETRAILLANMDSLVKVLMRYMGVGVMALAVLALIWPVLGKARREILFMVFPAFALMVVPLLLTFSTGSIPSRYLLPQVAPLAALAAFSLTMLLSYLSRFAQTSRRLVGITLVALCILPALRFDAILIGNPADTPLLETERAGYYEHDNNLAVQQAAHQLVTIWQDGSQKLGLLGPPHDIRLLHAYLGPRAASIGPLTPDSDGREQLAAWLAEGKSVYLFGYEDNLAPYLRTWSDVSTELANSYGTLQLFRVTGVQSTVANQVYSRLTGDHLIMSSHPVWLTAALEQEVNPAPLIVYPPSATPFLSEHSALDIIPLPLEFWPPTPESTQAALDSLNLSSDGTPVDMVFVNEPRTDPDGVVALTLQQSLYYTGGESWSGVLHRRRYVTGPTESTPPMIEVVYEDAITLQAALIDNDVRPGDAIRVSARWQTSVEVQDTFHVFAEVVDQTGTLHARYTAGLGGGLLPITTWMPGQPVHDHCAIVLPRDLPPGLYEVRAGLFKPRSGLRLRVTGGSSGGADYAVLGQIMVSPPEG